MNKILVFFVCFISLFTQFETFGKMKDIKREPITNLASFLVFKQEKDSILNDEYKNALFFFKEDNFSKSLEKSLILLSKIEATNRIELKHLIYYLIGSNFSEMGNHDKSIKYFKKAFNVITDTVILDVNKLKNLEGITDKEYFIARNFLKIGLAFYKLKKNDSAIAYYNNVIKIKSFNKELLSTKASSYNNLSAIYINKGEYSIAKNFALKAVEIRKINRNSVKEASALNNLGSIHLLEKDFKKAKEVYIKALDLLENYSNNVATKYKEDINFNLAWVLYNLKDYTAYDYQEKSYLIKDSLRSVNFEHIVQGVFERHQIELEKEKVNLAKKKVDLRKAKEQRTAWFFGILSFLVIVSSGFIVYNYKLRQNNLKLKLDQTQLAQKSRFEKLKSESQVRILNATLDGKETERKQIAETLHDSVSSLLSSANLHLQATKMQFNGDSPIEINKAQKIIVEASHTIRDLSHALVSSVLLKFGLKYAIKDMAEKYSNSQIQINTDIKNLRRYHQSFEIKVNNIIQEFVNNILKHSNASKAIVRAEEKNGKLIISIQDNGDGFDKNKISEKDGLGINQIDARIQMMKGVFNIDSNAGLGAKIEIVLPILKKESIIHV